MPTCDPAKLEKAFQVVAQGVADEAYAGAVAAIGSSDGILALRPFGFAAREPEQVTMRAGTVFDLASLTKVVATTPAILRLLEEGAFVLETPVQHIVPEVKDARITIRHLLTHTSGLPAWRPLYLEHRGRAAYVSAIGQTALLRDPGQHFEYSDLGFILLGEIISRVSGMELSEYCRKAVFEPLGMQETGFLPRLPRQRTAATEKGNRVEYEMCGERARTFSRWRSGIIWGEANDGNAWYGLDGVAGHAGLFGTAADLALYAKAWLTASPNLLSRQTIAAATRSYTPEAAENRGLGWRKPPAIAFPPGRAPCGDLLSSAAYGHVGFTGTSLWIDPELDLFIILLTNCLHPTRSERIYHVRPAFCNAVVASLR